MKKPVLFLSVLSTFSGAVQAQSSVTLFGVVDAGLNYISNDGGKANWTLTSGVIQGSRWGLKGIEDLGGGLKAVFQVENGFSVTNGTLGQSGRMCGRQAWFGLNSRSVGALTLGRQYDDLVDFVQPVTGATVSGLAHPFDNDNLVDVIRINNSIKYTSADYNGFTFGGLYGFSNSPGAGFASNRAWSLGAGYVGGALTLGAGYLHLNNPNSNAIGAVTGEYPSVVLAGFTGAVTREVVWGGGATYVLGSTKVGLVYSHSEFDSTAASLKFDNFEIHADYQVTPALLLGGRYTFTNGVVDPAGTKPKYHQFELAVDYALSKRTDVYLIGAYQKATGDATHAVLAPDTFGAGGSFAPDASSNKSQGLARVGMRLRW